MKKIIVSISLAVVLFGVFSVPARASFSNWQRVVASHSGRRFEGDWRSGSWLMNTVSEVRVLRYQQHPTRGRASVRNSRGTTLTTAWHGPGVTARADMSRNGTMQTFWDLTGI